MCGHSDLRGGRGRTHRMLKALAVAVGDSCTAGGRDGRSGSESEELMNCSTSASPDSMSTAPPPQLREGAPPSWPSSESSSDRSGSPQAARVVDAARPVRRGWALGPLDEMRSSPEMRRMMVRSTDRRRAGGLPRARRRGTGGEGGERPSWLVSTRTPIEKRAAESQCAHASLSVRRRARLRSPHAPAPRARPTRRRSSGGGG
jgi:hypothetical protein